MASQPLPYPDTPVQLRQIRLQNTFNILIHRTVGFPTDG